MADAPVDHWTSLSDEEQAVVRLYKRSGEGLDLKEFCYELNELLRAQTPLSPVLAEAVERLDGSIRFPTPRPMTLYRAIDDVSILSKLEVGQEASFRAFTSTCRTWQRLSNHMKAAGGATKVGVLTLRVPMGFMTLDMDANPAFGTEAEILLPRGTAFRVIPRGEGLLTHYLDNARTRYVGLEEVTLELTSVKALPIVRAMRKPSSQGARRRSPPKRR